MNTLGKNFKITIIGESHGAIVGVVIDGCPAGLQLDLEKLQADLDRRRPGQSSVTTARNEADRAEGLTGLYEDHTTGRGHVKAMLDALELKDAATLGEHLLAYRDLLTGHIKKEDEILYPWMDRNLSISQVGELFAKFSEVDEKMGFSPEKYLNFIEKLEKKFNR